ncbi:MAG: hypothetical protein WBN62_12360, partial [Thermoanaerobaculia bacterium]
MQQNLFAKLSRPRGEQCRPPIVVWMLLASLSSQPVKAETNVPENSAVLESDRIDGIHRDLPADIAPIEQGAILI